jgi:hypothetical protein
MAKMIIKGMDVKVDSELYVAGMTEDGEAYTAEEYFVVIESVDGKRWAHMTSWKGCKVHHDDLHGTVSFEDIRNEAFLQADRLSLRVSLAKSIDLQYWNELEPVYGSVAYMIDHRIIDSCGNYL